MGGRSKFHKSTKNFNTPLNSNEGMCRDLGRCFIEHKRLLFKSQKDESYQKASLTRKLMCEECKIVYTLPPPPLLNKKHISKHQKISNHIINTINFLKYKRYLKWPVTFNFKKVLYVYKFCY